MTYIFLNGAKRVQPQVGCNNIQKIWAWYDMKVWYKFLQQIWGREI